MGLMKRDCFLFHPLRKINEKSDVRQKNFVMSRILFVKMRLKPVAGQYSLAPKIAVPTLTIVEPSAIEA